MTEFEAGWRASQGARPYQEDSLALWPGKSPLDAGLAADLVPPGLVTVLADGMGGHAGGAEASKLVCTTFLGAFGRAPDAPIAERLHLAMEAANQAVATKASEEVQLTGMGSTLVGAVFSPAGLEWLSVGDSPLYLYREEKIQLVNADHSLAPALDALAAQGHISVDQARNDPRRHMLRSAITGEDIELFDIAKKPLELVANDYVILSSDGIHTIDNDEIAELVKAYGASGPQSVADALVRRVEDAKDPTQDNVSIIVIRPKPAG